jgi:general secretion pathway protein G
MQNISHRMQRRRQGGFTLVEIMVVVVIIGILGMLVVPKLLGRTGEARVTAARTDIATLMQALKLYKLDNNYQYLQPGLHGEIDVFSLGADGQPGGAGEDADVGSWDK